MKEGKGGKEEMEVREGRERGEEMAAGGKWWRGNGGRKWHTDYSLCFEININKNVGIAVKVNDGKCVGNII